MNHVYPLAHVNFQYKIDTSTNFDDLAGTKYGHNLVDSALLHIYHIIMGSEYTVE